jgi:hypothetical protein
VEYPGGMHMKVTEIRGVAIVFTFPMIDSLGERNDYALYRPVTERMILFAQS